MPDSLYQQLRNAAHEQNQSMSEILRKSLTFWLASPHPITMSAVASSATATELTVGFFVPKDAVGDIPFSRFIDEWRGKTFGQVLEIIGIQDKELHAAMAGVALTEKALEAHAYDYLSRRAKERCEMLNVKC